MQSMIFILPGCGGPFISAKRLPTQAMFNQVVDAVDTTNIVGGDIVFDCKKIKSTQYAGHSNQYGYMEWWVYL